MSSSSNEQQFKDLWIAAVKDLLRVLSDAFPECSETSQCARLFTILIGANESFVAKSLDIWVTEMHPYCKLMLDSSKPSDTRVMTIISSLRASSKPGGPDLKLSSIAKALLFANEKEKEEIIEKMSHPIVLLDMLDIAGKWKDPGLTAEMKEYLMMYINRINGYALLHRIVPEQHVNSTIQHIRTLPPKPSGGTSELLTETEKTHRATMNAMVRPLLAAGALSSGSDAAAAASSSSEALNLSLAVQALQYPAHWDYVGGGGAVSNLSSAVHPLLTSMIPNMDLTKLDQYGPIISNVTKDMFNASELDSLTQDNLNDVMLDAIRELDLDGDIDKDLLLSLSKKIPLEDIKPVFKMLMEGNIGALTASPILPALLETLMTNKGDFEKLIGNVDIKKVISKLAETPMVTGNPMISSMVQTVMAGGEIDEAMLQSLATQAIFSGAAGGGDLLQSLVGGETREMKCSILDQCDPASEYE